MNRTPIDLSDLLSKDPELNQYKVVDMTPEGQVVIAGKDEAGNAVEEAHDPHEFVKYISQRDLGRPLSPDEYTLNLNSPSNPIQRSPLSEEQRLKIQFGNATGTINYLKKSFDGAHIDPDGNFSVKRGNAWYAVDPSGLGRGTPWEKTRELIKDTADISDELINGIMTGSATAIGGVLGFGTSGVPGAMATGLVAGGAGGKLSGMMRTRLGRALGTWQVDVPEGLPEEEQEAYVRRAMEADEAVEMWTSMAGGAIAPGVKPTAKAVWGALGAVKKKVTETGWRMATGIWSALTKIPGRNLDYIADNTVDFISRREYATKLAQKVAEQTGETVRPELIQEQAALLRNRTVQRMAEFANKKLQHEFKKVARSFAKLGGKLDIDAADLTDDVLDRLHRNNFLKFDPVKVGDDVVGIVPRALTAAERGAKLAPEVPEEKVFKKLLAFLHGDGESKGFRGLGTLTGEEGAENLIRFKAEINRQLEKAFTSVTDKKVDTATLTKVSQEIDAAILSRLTPAQQALWKQRAVPYERFGTAVEYLNRAISDPTKIDTLAKQLMAPNVKQNTAKKAVIGLVQSGDNMGADLLSLLGRGGEAIRKNLIGWDTVIHAAPTAPQVGWKEAITSGALGLAVTKATGIGVVGQAALAGGVVAASKPSLVASTIARTSQGLGGLRYYTDVMKGLSKNLGGHQMAKMLSNDHFLRQYFRGALSSYKTTQNIGTMTDNILQEAFAQFEEDK